ncbi:MAG: AI-2E family transporter [Parcubacteria group bacterium]|jgi:predicted PurR-regulated permease PerM
MQKNEIEISTGIVFRTILILLGLWFMYLVMDVIALVFIAVIITSAMDPLVDWLQRWKIPRTAGVLGLFFLLFLAIGLAISFLIPPMIAQFQDFSQNFPSYFQSGATSLSHLKDFFASKNIQLDLEQLSNNFSRSLTGLSGDIFSTTANVFSGFISIIVVFSLAFYMTVEENGIKKFIISVTPDRFKNYAANLATRVKEKIGKWMLGQLLLMLIIFVLDAIGLYLVGVPYALILAIFAGVMEIVPYIGPIISAIPGIILGFLISPTTGFLALLVYLIAQQVENHVIVPQVMKKAVGLNPVATIIALLVGLRLGGVLGAILAIPVATAISLVINDFMERRKAE